MNAEISRRRCLARLVALAAVLVLAGCGENGTLTGKVTYRGQPVPKANVYFLCEDKTSKSVKCDDLGNYTIKLPIGKAQVCVNNVDQVAPAMMSQMIAKQQSGKDTKADIEQSIKTMEKEIGDGRGGSVAVPRKYNTAESSGLIVHVAGGKQLLDIPLVD